MSNPTTNYRVGGVDLSAIFQPLSQGSAIGYDTNYTVSGYGDLRNIFAAYTGAVGTQAPVTGYSVTGHGDLNNIFAKMPLYSITGSLTYDVYAYGGYTGIVFTGGTGTITYFTNISTTVIAVGGGGGGGTQGSFIAGPAGGGGGTMIIPNFGINVNTAYNISVGSGGQPGIMTSSLQSGSNGGDSSFQDPTYGPLLNLHIGGGGGGGLFVGSDGYSGAGGSTNTMAGGGGGGGGGEGYGVPAGAGGNSATAYQGNSGSMTNGGTSFNNAASSGYPIYLPFISGNPQVYPGNGGGSGTGLYSSPPFNGGQAGSTIGGLNAGSLDQNGESGVSSISTGVFGAGGGGGGVSGGLLAGNGGSGGSGVVIIYWQTV
jgi:hypothetical protein